MWHKIWRKIDRIDRALIVGFAGVALAVSLGAPGAAAASNQTPHRATAAHRIHRAYAANHTYPAHHRQWFGRRNPATYGYANIPPNAFIGRNYVFVPGVGILGESCDLPTSACPNEYRDVQ